MISELMVGVKTLKMWRASSQPLKERSSPRGEGGVKIPNLVSKTMCGHLDFSERGPAHLDNIRPGPQTASTSGASGDVVRRISIRTANYLMSLWRKGSLQSEI